MRTFELFGYGRVWLPIFEYAQLLERTNSGVGSSLRFVEPDSGEIVALRSDMTPQIARVVSTRFRNTPLPARLCYQGSVLRRRRERARTEGQVVQAGIELVGMSGIEADLEVIFALCAAVRGAGLQHFVLDIGHAGVAGSLLAAVPEQARAGLTEALAAKDATVIERRGRAAGLRGKSLDALVALADLHGGGEQLQRAAAALSDTPAETCGRELQALFERVQRAECADKVVVDYGETSRFDYYTGAMFSVLARGPGEPLASGGRYDNVYARFGLPRPAAGCAIDLNNVCWALEEEGWIEPRYPTIVVEADASRALLTRLRSSEVACAVTREDPQSYADAWGFGFTLRSVTEPSSGLCVRARSGAQLDVPAGDVDEQARQIASFVKQHRDHD